MIILIKSKYVCEPPASKEERNTVPEFKVTQIKDSNNNLIKEIKRPIPVKARERWVEESPEFFEDVGFADILLRVQKAWDEGYENVSIEVQELRETFLFFKHSDMSTHVKWKPRGTVGVRV